jgi:integrase
MSDTSFGITDGKEHWLCVGVRELYLEIYWIADEADRNPPEHQHFARLTLSLLPPSSPHARQCRRRPTLTRTRGRARASVACNAALVQVAIASRSWTARVILAISPAPPPLTRESVAQSRENTPRPERGSSRIAVARFRSTASFGDFGVSFLWRWSALSRNRHGNRDRLIGLLIYRHGLRVSEACDLRWDDLDLTKRTIIVRRLKASNDSTHYLERDELAGLKALQRSYGKQGIKSAYVFVNERGQPFGRMGIARMIERAGQAAKLPFPVHVHMLRHSTGYALANRGMDTRRLQHFLGHASITNTVRYTAMSPEPFKDIWR